jgi:hypothetical protein
MTTEWLSAKSQASINRLKAKIGINIVFVSNPHTYSAELM